MAKPSWGKGKIKKDRRSVALSGCRTSAHMGTLQGLKESPLLKCRFLGSSSSFCWFRRAKTRPRGSVSLTGRQVSCVCWHVAEPCWDHPGPGLNQDCHWWFPCTSVECKGDCWLLCLLRCGKELLWGKQSVEVRPDTRHSGALPSWEGNEKPQNWNSEVFL